MGEPSGSVIAVIPARGGSKRIPRKNIRPFLGVPLLSRTVRRLLASEVFDRVVVSTDDDEVAQVGADAGAEVPFRRPPHLADDVAPTAPVVAHAIEMVTAGAGDTVSAVCCVYPAAVTVRAEDLREALTLLRSGPDLDFVISATTFPAPIQRALRRHPDGTCEMLWPEHRLTRTQDLEESYHDAGQFYWGKTAAWLALRPFFSRTSALLPLPRWRVQDVDTEEDWRRAEAMVLAIGEDS